LSRHVVNDVEIIERETMRTVRIDDGVDAITESLARPQLLIDDDEPASRPLVAKKRSDLRELDAFLRKIVSPQRLAG
jgi:hypothetical protein